MHKQSLHHAELNILEAQKLLLQFEDPVTLLFESNLFTSSSHKGCASLHLRAGKRNEEEVGTLAA